MAAEWRFYLNEANGLAQFSDLPLAMAWFDVALGYFNPLKAKEFDEKTFEQQFAHVQEGAQAVSYAFQALNVKPRQSPLYENVFKKYASTYLVPRPTPGEVQQKGQYIPYKGLFKKRWENTSAIVSTANGANEVNLSARPGDYESHPTTVGVGAFTLNLRTAELVTKADENPTQNQAKFEAQLKNDIYWKHAATYDAPLVPASIAPAQQGRNIVKPGTNILIPSFPPSWRTIHWEYRWALTGVPEGFKTVVFSPLCWNFEFWMDLCVQAVNVGVFEMLEDAGRFTLLVNLLKAREAGVAPTELLQATEAAAQANLEDAASRRSTANGISAGFGIAASVATAAIPQPFGAAAGAFVGLIGLIASALQAAGPAMRVINDMERYPKELETASISGQMGEQESTPPTQNPPDPPGFDRAFYVRLLKAQGHWPIEVGDQSYSVKSAQKILEESGSTGIDLPPSPATIKTSSSNWTTGEKVAVGMGVVGGLALVTYGISKWLK